MEDDMNNNPIFICDVCGCWFSSKCQYMIHTNSHFAFNDDDGEDVNRITINTTDSKEFTNLKDLIECDFQISSLMIGKTEQIDDSCPLVSAENMYKGTDYSVNKICNFNSPKCQSNLNALPKINSDGMEELKLLKNNKFSTLNDMSDNVSVKYTDEAAHPKIHHDTNTPICRSTEPNIKLLSMEMECKRRLFHFKGTRKLLPVLSLHRHAIQYPTRETKDLSGVVNVCILCQ